VSRRLVRRGGGPSSVVESFHLKTGPGTLGSGDPHEITDLLRAWSGGRDAAFETLLPKVYAELRRMARAHLARERSGHTLQPTALVHEVYLRLARERKLEWENRAHFFGACARLMRRILVDHARRRQARKRSATPWTLSSFDDSSDSGAEAVDLIALDRALVSLETLAPRQCRVVEMRFFAGLSIEETADSLGVASRTVKLDWTKARAWLYRELTRRDA
jgi:RNA polymerase sigma-70 factor (ECF subfamily)